jgi:hypothetical protein
LAIGGSGRSSWLITVLGRPDDPCPVTGRGRLSTHLAEEGVNLPLLMAKSGHQNLRSLQRYARPSADAVAAMTAAHDRARRRR